MTTPTTDTPNGRNRKRSASPLSDKALDQARGAAGEVLAEAWDRFLDALVGTDGELPASISVTLAYKPPKGDEAAELVVAGKANLPTQRHSFSASMVEGQLSLMLEG